MRSDSSSHDPYTLEAFTERHERAYLLVGREQGLSEFALAAAAMVRRLRYRHSLSKARSALLAGDVQGARNAVRDAFRQQHTVRAAAVVGALRLSPGLLRPIHPIKNRIQNALRRARFRMSYKRRELAPARPGSAGLRTPLEAQP